MGGTAFQGDPAVLILNFKVLGATGPVGRKYHPVVGDRIIFSDDGHVWPPGFKCKGGGRWEQEGELPHTESNPN